jgi:hypothetical protein
MAKPNWIKGAVKRPGQLHRDLGVPQGQKIGAEKIEEAAEQGGKTGQRARFALVLRGLRGKKK